MVQKTNASHKDIISVPRLLASLTLSGKEGPFQDLECASSLQSQQKMMLGSFFFLPNDDCNHVSLMPVLQKWPEGELMNFVGFSVEK